jgi:hypothetical protein
MCKFRAFSPTYVMAAGPTSIRSILTIYGSKPLVLNMMQIGVMHS